MAVKRGRKADLAVVEPCSDVIVGQDQKAAETAVMVAEPAKIGRPRTFQDPEKFAVMVDDYFDWCDTQTETSVDARGNERVRRKPYTVSGLCLYLGTDRVTLLDYQEMDGFSSTIKNAKMKIENNLEENIMAGKSNPIFGIFSLKNNFGWKDKSEVDINQKSLIITSSSDELWSKISSFQDKYK